MGLFGFGEGGKRFAAKGAAKAAAAREAAGAFAAAADPAAASADSAATAAAAANTAAASAANPAAASATNPVADSVSVPAADPDRTPVLLDSDAGEPAGKASCKRDAFGAETVSPGSDGASTTLLNEVVPSANDPAEDAAAAGAQAAAAAAASRERIAAASREQPAAPDPALASAAPSAAAAPAPAAPVFRAGGSSERGGRYANEDWFIVGEDFACVSDGIGGAAYGDVMSRICARALQDAWVGLADGDLGPADRMRAAFSRADALASTVGSYLEAGSGATLVAAALSDGELVFGAVGDSAAQLLDGTELRSALPGDGRRSGEGNALDVALGYGSIAGDPGLVRVASVPARPGMRALLSTDGVWTQLESELVATLLSEGDDPYACAYRIARTAAEAGGATSDNATAVAVFVAPAAAPSTQAAPAQPRPAACTCTPTMIA